MPSRKGYSLVELIIVMAIFSILMMISAAAFNKIVTVSSSVSKSAESQIEGIVGLEMLRRDLNSTGYALPWAFQSAITYAEYDTPNMCPDSPIKGICGGDYNDAPSAVPRAIWHGVVPDTSGVALGGTSGNNRDAIKGSDYLVIRSATVAFNNSVGKWSFVNYSVGAANSNISYIHKWNSAEDLVSNEAVITLVDTFSTAPVQRQLAMESGTSFSYKLGTANSNGYFSPPHDNYKPTGNIKKGINNEAVNAYALNNFTAGSADTIRMPFNRADYFIRRPFTTMPSGCNPGTGILYKGVVINSTSTSGGGMTSYPLIDCVGDMQVVFDMRDATDTTINRTTDTLVGLSAQDIRTRLKSIRVYLLTHEGRKDKNFTYPNDTIFVGDPKLTSFGRQFTADTMLEFFGSEWRNYRWKVITVVGQPYNLMF